MVFFFYISLHVVRINVPFPFISFIYIYMYEGEKIYIKWLGGGNCTRTAKMTTKEMTWASSSSSPILFSFLKNRSKRCTTTWRRWRKKKKPSDENLWEALKPLLVDPQRKKRENKDSSSMSWTLYSPLELFPPFSTSLQSEVRQGVKSNVSELDHLVWGWDRTAVV